MTPTQTPVDTATDTPTLPPPPVDTATPTPGNGLPPDPADVAPALEAGVATRMLAATDFLYTGPNPIQTGVAPGTIVAERAAVLRGLVTDRNNAPLSGVSITILGHPELGQTLTRADGMFDLAVNGGGQLTVDYQKAGFLPAQRQASVPWEDYVALPDVILIPLDPAVTSVDLTAAIPIQVARGSQVSDSSGTRQATVLVPQGTGALMIFTNGATQPLDHLSVRATEYTVGPNGPNAMPAELPPTSGYTYAVELSVDEAIAAGAAGVQFSAPLPFYVENFLGFPVGATVPLGMYDRQSGKWEAQPSGRVIKILSFSGGLADLDVDGNGVADTGATLTALSITDAERQQLATLYASGQTLWRMLAAHFSPFDGNWPLQPPADAIGPQQDPELDEPQDESCEAAGSIIECENQILGEEIPVTGTGQGLHYRSDRVPGYTSAYTIEIPLTGDNVPTSLQSVQYRVNVAGRTVLSPRFAPNPNTRTVFSWNGVDAYGRRVSGAQRAVVQVLYNYRAVYAPAGSFGAAADGAAYAIEGRTQAVVFRTWVTQLGNWHAESIGLGGWTLNQHHTYDPIAKVLYRGDGHRESTRSLGPSIATTAGTGTQCASVGGTPCGDGGQATAAQLRAPSGLAVGPDGSLYIATGNVIRRVGRDGVITTVVGTGAACTVAPCGDGGPATQAQLGSPAAVAVGPDNSLYIADRGSSQRVRIVGPDGIIRAFAGDGSSGSGGDGGPALVAQVSGVNGIAIGPDGSIYVSQSVSLPRIRRIGPDGVISLYAGGGTNQADPAPAIGTVINPIGIAIGPDGSLYIADNLRARIRKVTPDGIMRVIAGSGPLSGGYSGDGGPATQARLNNPLDVAVDSDGTVYIGDAANNRIRWLRPDGNIDTLAGTGAAATTGDGGLAGQATLQQFGRMALAPDGAIYFSQFNTNFRIRRISPLGDKSLATGLIVPSVDGSEVYTFTQGGRHLQTFDALTGALRLDFGYDAANRLATITDPDGNVMRVEHDAQGHPIAIVAPFGQRTTLTVDANGYLASVAQPGGETVQLDYTNDGLLTGMTMPSGDDASYAYEGRGRLMSATDTTNATKTLLRSGTNKDHTVTITSALGRVSHFRVAREGINSTDVRLTTTDSAGGVSTLLIRANGIRTGTEVDGTTMTLTVGPDPRWGMRVPIPASLTIATPNGLTRTTTLTRAVTLASPGDFLNVLSLTQTETTNGRASVAQYNGTTRTLTQTFPTGTTERVVFDARGRVTENHLGNLEARNFSYEARGRLQTVAEGQGANARLTTLAYGADGFLASITNPLLQTTGFTYDVSGRLMEQELPSGAIIAFDYNVNGDVTSITPPGQPSHGFAYTPRREVSKYTAPAVGIEPRERSVTYDDDRGIAQIDRPGGQTLAFAYDSAGRKSMIDIATTELTYGYDTASRVTSLNTSDAIGIGLTYDGSLATSATVTGIVSGSVSQAYDNDFRVATLGVNGNDPITIQYNGDSLPIQIGALTLTRHPQTGLVTNSALGTLTEARTYNGFGARDSHVVSRNASSLYSVSYGRDLLGRITSKTETVEGTTRVFGYTYDLDARLTEVREDGVLTATYTYDDNGNRLTFTDSTGTTNADHDARDRLIQYGADMYTYSANGELVRKEGAGVITTYEYNGAGDLSAANLPDGTRIDYVIDGGGRRIGKKLNGALVQGFLYENGLRPAAELNASSDVVSRFVYADSNDNVPAYMTKGGVTYRIVTDQVGSPRLVIDSATGQIVQRMDYDAFGRVLLDTNPGFQPFGFAGGLYERDTGLVHFGLREYDAEIGRWITRDPIGFAGGDTNLYRYVGGDPVNASDPYGLCGDAYTCGLALDTIEFLDGDISVEEYNQRLEDRVDTAKTTWLLVGSLWGAGRAIAVLREGTGLAGLLGVGTAAKQAADTPIGRQVVQTLSGPVCRVGDKLVNAAQNASTGLSKGELDFITRYSEKAVKGFGEVTLGKAGDVAGTIVRGSSGR